MPDPVLDLSPQATEEPTASNTVDNDTPRPYAEALALVGYMTPESLRTHIPNARIFPASVQAEIEARLGRSLPTPLESTYKPARFQRVQEREVLAQIQQIVGAVPAGLENLTGFEWIEIENLIAGQLTTGPIMPGWESFPADIDWLKLARFCLFSGALGHLPVNFQMTPDPVLRCDWNISGSLEVFRVENGKVLLQFALQPVLDPIRVLLVDGRAIAINGLERLAVLAQNGYLKALCIVSYGYGLEALTHFPSADNALLSASRPPLVIDLNNSDLTVRIPVRHPVTLLRPRLETLSVGG